MKIMSIKTIEWKNGLIKLIDQTLLPGELKYLYIDGLKDKDNVTTIYVPTEAGLPILEAGKR